MFAPGSIIFIIFLILCFRSKNVLLNLLLFTIVFELQIEIGYLVRLGNTSVLYRQAAEIILFFYCLSYYVKEPQKYTTPLIACSLCAPVISLISLFVCSSDVIVGTHTVTLDNFFIEGDRLMSPHPNKFVYQNTIFCIMSIVDISVIYKKFSSKDYLTILFKAYRYTIAFVICGYVEFISKYIFKDIERWGRISMFFWGVGSGSASLGRERGNGFELNLFTLEASHYAYVLMVSALIILSVNHLKNKSLIDTFFISVIVLLIASTSFSSVMYLAFLGIVIMHYRWNIRCCKFKNIEQILVAIFIVLLLVLISSIPYLEKSDFFLAQRFVKVSNELTSFSLQDADLLDTSDGSTRIRLFSVILALQSFLARPLFGHGIDAVYCHGSFAMLLSGLGLVGSLLWIKVMFGIIYKRIKVEFNKKWYYLIISSLLLTHMVLSLGIRPFYELTFILISFSIIAICTNNQNMKVVLIKDKIINRLLKEKT